MSTSRVPACAASASASTLLVILPNCLDFSVTLLRLLTGARQRAIVIAQAWAQKCRTRALQAHNGAQRMQHMYVADLDLTRDEGDDRHHDSHRMSVPEFDRHPVADAFSRNGATPRGGHRDRSGGGRHNGAGSALALRRTEELEVQLTSTQAQLAKAEERNEELSMQARIYLDLLGLHKGQLCLNRVGCAAACACGSHHGRCFSIC